MTKRLVGAVGTSSAACPRRGGRVLCVHGDGSVHAPSRHLTPISTAVTTTQKDTCKMVGSPFLVAATKLFYALTTELAFEYVIRLRGDISVTSARGERRAAAAWVGAGGRARRLVGARVTDVHEWLVGAVVCVHDQKMDEPWCLVASEASVPTRVLIRYYGKRWGIEAGFRDITSVPQSQAQASASCGRARSGGEWVVKRSSRGRRSKTLS